MSEAGSSRLISPALAIGLAIVSALSLVAYVALSAYAPDFRNESNGEAHVLSSSAIGFAGLKILLGEEGVPTVVDRGTLVGNSRQVALTILTPGITSSSSRIKSLCKNDTCLIVLPKWIPFGSPLQRGYVMKSAPFPGTTTQTLLYAFVKDTKVAQAKGTASPVLASPVGWLPLETLRRRIAPIDFLQTLSGTGWIPEISGSGGLLLGRLANSEIYVLADPDVLNTHGLKDLATARLASAIIDKLRFGPGPVSFDVTLNGLGESPDILRNMFAPPFLGATLCALIAALLVFWHALSRFGAPERAEPGLGLGKRALIENTAALVRMMRREPRMAPRYAIVMRTLVLRSLGLGRRMDPAQIDFVLGALERRSAGDSFSALSAEAQTVRNRSDLLRISERLFRWRERIIHAR